MSSRILRKGALVGSATVAVKLVAMTKEVKVASYFGRGDVVDAFLIAYLIPGFLVLLFASSLNAALMPTLVRERGARGQEATNRLFCQAVLVSQAGLVALCIALGFAAPILFRHLVSQFAPEKLLLTQQLFWALLPMVLFSGLSTNCAAYLNTTGCFAVPALTPMLTPAITLVLLNARASAWGVWSLVAGAFIGTALEATVLLLLLCHRGVRISLGRGVDRESRRIALQYVAVCGAGLLSSGVGLLDQSMAAWLPAGSVAALAYGGRLVAAAVALISTSISTVLMPLYSEAVAKQDWRACRDSMQRVARFLFAATIPLTILLFATSPLLIRTLYQHGAFTSADSAVVARVQAMYALQLPFYGVAPVYLRFLVAIRRNDLIVASAGINLVLDFVLNLLCMRWGPAGLALSTSLFYVASFFFLRFWALRLLAERESTPTLRNTPAALVTEVTHA